LNARPGLAGKGSKSRLCAITRPPDEPAYNPDNLPLAEQDFKRMKRVPRTKTLRRALMLTQEEFAARYHIPIGTLRDWEQGRTEPDAPAKALLHLIAVDPEWAAEKLNSKPELSPVPA
jgi:putative transcriptional regulator